MLQTIMIPVADAGDYSHIQLYSNPVFLLIVFLCEYYNGKRE